MSNFIFTATVNPVKVSEIAAGTYSNVTQLVFDRTGRITKIGVSESTTLPTAGAVLAVLGTPNQITVTTSTGNAQYDLSYAGGSTGTTVAINQISVDQFNRVNSVSSASISSGTYANPTGITVDPLGRVTSITPGSAFTGTVGLILPAITNPDNSSGSNPGAFFTGTTYVSQVIETFNTATSVYSTSSFLNGSVNIYTFTASTSSVFYIPSTTANFSFEILLYYLGYNLQVSTPWGAKQPVMSFTIIVNNTGGYSISSNPVFGAPVKLTASFSTTSTSWLNGIRPVGVTNRVEVYNFTIPAWSQSPIMASMSTYG